MLAFDKCNSKSPDNTIFSILLKCSIVIQNWSVHKMSFLSLTEHSQNRQHLWNDRIPRWPSVKRDLGPSLTVVSLRGTWCHPCQSCGFWTHPFIPLSSFPEYTLLSLPCTCPVSSWALEFCAEFHYSEPVCCRKQNEMYENFFCTLKSVYLFLIKIMLYIEF